MYIYTLTHIYAYIHLHLSTYVYVHIHMHIHMHVHIHIHVHIFRILWEVDVEKLELLGAASGSSQNPGAQGLLHRGLGWI